VVGGRRHHWHADYPRMTEVSHSVKSTAHTGWVIDSFVIRDATYRGPIRVLIVPASRRAEKYSPHRPRRMSRSFQIPGTHTGTHRPIRLYYVQFLHLHLALAPTGQDISYVSRLFHPRKQYYRIRIHDLYRGYGFTSFTR
jgi:hypothetical protein